MMLKWVAATSVALAAVVNATYINYTTVTGYFLQDVNTTNATTFDYTAVNFGLINQTYIGQSNDSNLTQWERFAQEVVRLNLEAPSNVEYKLLIMGRHGEGWHNAAETCTDYGTPAWNCFWSLENGNATASWADAELDAAGIKQAQHANSFWQHEIAVEKIPTPQTFYVSPLQRCLATANITFSGLDLPLRYPFNPTIKELLREGISIHTCDRRHNKTYIHQTFPTFDFEPGFVEEDPYWNGVTAETNAAQNIRSKKVLDQIFSNDTSTYISITSHSGEIGSILTVLGHQAFSLNTGAVIPVLVRAETQSQNVSTTSATWTASAHCTTPPVTSISSASNGGCVCPSSAAPVTTPLITIGPFKKM